MMKRSFKCKVKGLTFLNEEVYTLTLEKPIEMSDIKPSQFFNLKSHVYPYLRRPVSISYHDEHTLGFTIIIKGEGTRRMSRLKVGDYVEVLGPLGNAYVIKKDYKDILIVGGGIGVPPQAVLAEAIKKHTNAHIKVQLGFRHEPYLIERFKAVTDDVTIASENAEADYKGYVTDLTEKTLEKSKVDMIYVCGPPIVIKKVAKMCVAKNIPVQLLMEERMACGVGACMVCTCKVKDDTKPDNYWYKRVCVDGPVFWGHEVIFDA